MNENTLPKLPVLGASFADYAQRRSTTLGPEWEWGSDPATFAQSLSAMSTIGPVVLEWQYTGAEESSSGSSEPKKNC